MAPTAKQIRLIKQKLESLEQEKQNFLATVSKQVEPVVNLGKNWLENQEATGASFQQVRDALEKAIVYVFDAAEDVGGEAGAEKVETAATDDEETVQSPSLLSLSSFASSSTATPSFVISPSMEQVISSLQERMDKLENVGNKINHDVHGTNSELKQLRETVVLLEEKVCRLEVEKKSLEDKVNVSEERDEGEQAKPLPDVDRLEAKVDQLTTGMIRVKKLEDRLKQNDEQRLKDLRAIKDLGSTVATYTARIDKEKKRQRPIVGCAVVYDGCKFAMNTPVLFNVMLSNPSNLYDKYKGVFTAPVEGLYHIKLEDLVKNTQIINQHPQTVLVIPEANSKWQRRQTVEVIPHKFLANSELQLIQVPVNPEPHEDKEWLVAGTKPCVEGGGDSSSDVMEVKIGMSAGDKLFVKDMSQDRGHQNFSWRSIKCSCFLID